MTKELWKTGGKRRGVPAHRSRRLTQMEGGRSRVPGHEKAREGTRTEEGGRSGGICVLVTLPIPSRGSGRARRRDPQARGLVAESVPTQSRGHGTRHSAPSPPRRVSPTTVATASSQSREDHGDKPRGSSRRAYPALAGELPVAPGRHHKIATPSGFPWQGGECVTACGCSLARGRGDGVRPAVRRLRVR